MTERTKMMLEYVEGGYSVAALARRHSVSRKTAYKWIGRFEEEQWPGLQDRSRAPHNQRGAVSDEVEAQILALKSQWPLWGAPKVHFILQSLMDARSCPCESSVSNILRRHGLTKAPKPRRIRGPQAPMEYGKEPNQTWCADFKGWWRTQDGRRCDPLTITDASSRYLIRCQAFSESTATAMVQPVFIAAFREHGVPQAMRTDNGPPFASGGLCGLSKLSVWWLKQGIRLDRIEPGHPEQNGRHERMHRTLKEAIGAPARNLRAQQAVLDGFRHQYNEERPHEALGFGVPAAHYAASSRAWSEKLPGAIQYADDWESRRVRPSGQMKWRNHDVRISDALVGERIGLKPQADGVWEVFFGTMSLGIFDERKKRLQAHRKKEQLIAEPPVPDVIFGDSGLSPSLRSAQEPEPPKNHGLSCVNTPIHPPAQASKSVTHVLPRICHLCA
ncbi:MAG: IS481 family transposase [Prosthecobacter sp.]|nr:IS481 family transposase [Prosthecobacter sp.]